MGFIKIIKNKPYFKRYQTKFRRRREGKTDYRARKRLVAQDKNKYNSPKYRLVVRVTNSDVVCQIIYSKLSGDFVVSSAYSHELKKYGMSVGLTNYAAAYATGLLLARRVLTKFKLAEKYVGNTKVNGEDYNVAELADGPRPFCALLDVGLTRTTTGNKVFAALKGACDGGMNVPHSENRFVGYNDEEKKLDAESLRKHIFGLHVGDYMKLLKEEDPEKFQKHFSDYVKAGIKPEDLEKTWTKVHAAIRADPTHKKKETKGDMKKYPTHKAVRRSLLQRKDRIRQKLAAKARKA